MKMYVFSFGAGILVGVVYYLLNVRSPAPPVVALLGLLGMLIGEQAIPMVKQWTSPNSQITNQVSPNPATSHNHSHDKESA